MNSERFRGTGVALVTPFGEDLSVDFAGLKRTLDHVSKGADYLVVLGTTGESPTLSFAEKMSILAFVLENNPRNLPVVYGHGGSNTRELIAQMDELGKFPLDALLSVSPYYSKPSQKGIFAHYTALADASPFPLMLYNVPARTASNLAAETTIQLAKHANIIGTKEAAGDLVQCARIRAATSSEFLLLSGDDALTLPIISLGGDGVISVLANLQPVEFGGMVKEALHGHIATAQALNQTLLTGYDLAGAEGNPVSIKTGMEAAGLISRRVRLPLVAGSDELMKRFKGYLMDFAE